MIYVAATLAFTSIFMISLYYSNNNRNGRKLAQKTKRAPRKLGNLLNPKSTKQNLAIRLTSAGSNLKPGEFLAIKVLLAAGSALGYTFLIGPQNIKPLWLLGLAVVGFMVPNFWLRSKQAKRAILIRRELPEVIDLLLLCIGGGLGFTLALKRVIENLPEGPLSGELKLAWHEVQMGGSRQDALKNMAKRVNLPEVSSFARSVVQADKMGQNMEEALRMHSEEALLQRFQRGERLALQAPMKLLIPLIFFILPVVLIIVGGPILLQFMRMGKVF